MMPPRYVPGALTRGHRYVIAEALEHYLATDVLPGFDCHSTAEIETRRAAANALEIVRKAGTAPGNGVTRLDTDRIVMRAEFENDQDRAAWELCRIAWPNEADWSLARWFRRVVFEPPLREGTINAARINELVKIVARRP
jgi:hypothetical protein